MSEFCQSCQFVVAPGVAAVEGACPNCGVPYRPERDQPSPTRSDMELRNMPGVGGHGDDDPGGNPLQEGILADGGWQNRMKRDESFASVRTADFGDDFSLGIQTPAEEGPKLDVRVPTHKFIVVGDGSVLSSPEPTTHDEVANESGQPGIQTSDVGLGVLYGNGQTKWYRNSSGLHADQLAQALSSFYGHPVEVDATDPNLRARSETERWQEDAGVDISKDPHFQEQEAMAWRGRPFGYYDNPFFNRGGSVDAQSQEFTYHLPWYVAHDIEIPMETTEVIEPGGYTEEVVVQGAGLHPDVLDGLHQLGVEVNGKPLTPEYMEQLSRHWSGNGTVRDDDPSQWQQNYGQTITVTADDAQKAQIARQIVETSSKGPLLQHIKSTNAGHEVSVQLPHGFTPPLHAALGNLQAWVENPLENGQLRPYPEYHTVISPELRKGVNQVRIGVQNPQVAEVINQVARTNDLAPLYQHRGVQPPHQSSQRVAIAPLALLAGGAVLRAAAPRLMGSALGQGAMGLAGRGMMGAGVTQALGIGGEQQPQEQQAQEQQVPIHGLDYYASEFNHPSTHEEIPKAEDGDTKQHDDGDEYFGDDGVNDIGGTTQGEDKDADLDEFANSPGVERFNMLLPLVLHWAESEESGESDPLLKGLHESLEQEFPGYLDEPGDDNAVQEIIMLLKGDDSEAPDEEESKDDTPADRNDETKEAANHTPAVQGSCPHCGSTSDPSDGQCPQCYGDMGGAPLKNLAAWGDTHPVKDLNREGIDYLVEESDFPPGMTLQEYRQMTDKQKAEQKQPSLVDRLFHRASDAHQGPHSPEQFAAVAQYLQESGRGGEIPNMIMSPQDYAEELAQIAQRNPVPEDMGNEPQPAQEEAPPGATMPMPGMSVPGGGGGGMQDPGMAMMAALKQSIPHEQLHVDHHENTQGVPAADRERPEDISQEQDTSRTWVDENGEPLKVGSEYEMFTPKYDIPDIIRVNAVKPEAIEYTLTGEYGLEHKTEVNHEEAQLEGYSFRSLSGGDAEIEPELPEEKAAIEEVAPGEQSDLSSPHEMALQASTEASRCPKCGGPRPCPTHGWGREDDEHLAHDPAAYAEANPDLAWLVGEDDDDDDAPVQKEAGKKWTPMEQREFIDEQGVARNADKLDLAGTHYEARKTTTLEDDMFLFGW